MMIFSTYHLSKHTPSEGNKDIIVAQSAISESQYMYKQSPGHLNKHQVNILIPDSANPHLYQASIQSYLGHQQDCSHLYW